MTNPEVQIAQQHDLEEILQLQKRAYVSESNLYPNTVIPPLLETLEELQQEFQHCIIFKIMKKGKVVGAVRYYEKKDTGVIGRLIVEPNDQNQGIGTKLMTHIITHFGTKLRLELFTGHLSSKNILFYEKLGFKKYKEEVVSEELTFVYLEKVPMM